MRRRGVAATVPPASILDCPEKETPSELGCNIDTDLTYSSRDRHDGFPR
jgi:hypothetical protein